MGDFRSFEEMRAFAEQAKRIPAKEAAFRALYLNQPVDTEQRFLASAGDDPGDHVFLHLLVLDGCLTRQAEI